MGPGYELNWLIAAWLSSSVNQSDCAFVYHRSLPLLITLESWTLDFKLPKTNTDIPISTGNHSYRLLFPISISRQWCFPPPVMPITSKIIRNDFDLLNRLCNVKSRFYLGLRSCEFNACPCFRARRPRSWTCACRRWMHISCKLDLTLVEDSNENFGAAEGWCSYRNSAAFCSKHFL